MKLLSNYRTSLKKKVKMKRISRSVDYMRFLMKFCVDMLVLVAEYFRSDRNCVGCNEA